MKRMLAIAAAAALIAGCARNEPPDESPEVRVDVKIAHVRSGPMARTVTATGSTVLRREAQLRAPVTGVIVRFGLYNGDRVKAGETVAEIRPREAQAALQGAEELLRAARTPKDTDEARRAVELARSNVPAVPVRAPMTGILTSRVKNDMEVVSEGESIAVVVDPASVVFLADVPVTAVHDLRTGEAAAIRLGGRTFPATVHRIEPTVNANDQTLRVQLAFDGAPPGLEGSLFGEASIVVGTKEHALIVPSAAILRDDELNTTSIMVVRDDSLAVRVPVTAGIAGDTAVEVSAAGLRPGDDVITEGQYGLPDSTRVRIVK